MKDFMPDGNYFDRIMQLKHDFMTMCIAGSEIRPLLRALGCRYVSDDGASRPAGPFTICTPPQPDVLDEPIVRDVLQQALRFHVRTGLMHDGDSFSLLQGLYVNNRFHDCLANVDDAYALAALCTEVADETTVSHVLPDGTYEYPCLWLLLNEWLKPETNIPKQPSKKEVLRLFFGDAWYELCVEHTGIEDWELPGIVNNTKPPFRPGLLRIELEPTAIGLPSLDNA
jgi:hypothetical protein